MDLAGLTSELIYRFSVGVQRHKSHRLHILFIVYIVYTKYSDQRVAVCLSATAHLYKNSSWDEIANVNFYAVRPEGTGIRWNNAK